MVCYTCKQNVNGSYVLTDAQHKTCLECFAAKNSPKTVEKSTTVNGATKHDNSKTDLSLIPLSALIAEAVAFEVGEAKYGRYNYTKGHKASQVVAATMRHLLAWFDGEECDPVDGQSHLGAARANLAMIIEQQKLGTLKDNRRLKV